MRIDLSKLDVEGLVVELPSASAAEKRRIEVRSALELSGTFTRDRDGFHLSNADCMRLLLSGLDLHFAKVAIGLRGEGELAGLLADFGSAAGKLEGWFESLVLEASGLVVTVGALQVSGQVHGSKVRLTLRGGAGELRAERALFTKLTLRVGELVLDAPSLEVSELKVAWGDGGVRVEARAAALEQLVLQSERLTLRASQLTLEQPSVLGERLRANAVRVAHAEVDAALGGARRSEAAPQTGRAEAAGGPVPHPAFDYRVLDGLSGSLDVDVFLDLAVPVLGSRRAVHELRVAIEGGTIDYRELEQDLAAIEDALLDFSVREGALVLEWGLPLITSRGAGKPILRWDLSPADLALAEKRRVRLAVLPCFRLAANAPANAPEEPVASRAGEEPTPSRLALRKVAFTNLASELRLTAASAPLEAAVRALSLTSLRLRGALQRDAALPDCQGSLQAELEGLEATLDRLAVGGHALRAGLSIAGLRAVEVGFLDLSPRRVRGTLEGGVLSELELCPGVDRSQHPEDQPVDALPEAHGKPVRSPRP